MKLSIMLNFTLLLIVLMHNTIDYINSKRIQLNNIKNDKNDNAKAGNFNFYFLYHISRHDIQKVFKGSSTSHS